VTSLTLPGVSVSAWGGEDDFFETGREPLELLLPKLPRRLFTGRWALLEPCAGRGAILDVMIPAIKPVRTGAVEINRERFEECVSKHLVGPSIVHGDFLTMDVRAQFPAVFDLPRFVPMNPPYSKKYTTIGLDFVERCIELAQPDGIVAAMLQTDFCCGVDRTERVHAKYPSCFYPLKRRPQFAAEFSSGKRPFAWFVFDLLEPKREWGVLG